MALFVHDGIHKLPNILIHIQLLVYSPLLFISPMVHLLAQAAIYLLPSTARWVTGCFGNTLEGFSHLLNFVML